ncbi:MAG TPA: tetratricopeptide repeat protein [Devosiaceae bacterium]|nr:tetratricopeptide repeat protein [Devosiaceae bacterium]
MAQDAARPPAEAGATAADASAAIRSAAGFDAGSDSFGFVMAYSVGVTSDELLSVLRGAAQAGQPLAAWQLGIMYENGDGVETDLAAAFEYFERIVENYARTAPKSLDADIVASSFVKVAQYYRSGLPEAGIAANRAEARRLIAHAASYFGNPEAQFQLAQYYLDANELGYSPVQSAYWLNAAARKGHKAAIAMLPDVRFHAGEAYLDADHPAYNPAESIKWLTSAALSGHVGAQARLGALLVSGEGIEPHPVEGLRWLAVALKGAEGTPDAARIAELLRQALAAATPAERDEALLRSGVSLAGLEG